MFEESADNAGSPPAWSITNLRIPGLGVHFDPMAPAATPPASSPGTGSPGASPTPGSVPASPAGAPKTFDWSTAPAEFRGAYENTKRELDELRGKYQPWEKLGDPQQVTQSHQTWTRMSQEAEQLGQTLGYDLNEVRQLFSQDPVAVLAHLRQKAQSRSTQPLDPNNIRTEVQRMLQEGMRPMNERYDAQLNREAEGRFDQAFERLYKAEFKDGLPDEARDAIYEMASSLMGEDETAIKRLKFEGQTSDVAKYYTAAKERFLKVVTAYNTWERDKVTGKPPESQKKPETPKDWKERKLSTGQKLGSVFR